MKGYSSKEIIKILEADGWYLVRIKGDHYHFKHPTKRGIVTAPHPNRNLKAGTLKSIEKQSGLKFN